mmetsp:Transcript_1072/g.1200  ORF Transcript_1072/g.1200 Transcript_1072/m.1200 type:complete len:200 (-) Transcript_1072:1261-1860(-)
MTSVMVSSVTIISSSTSRSIIFIMEPASSSRSIALSGKNRSAMYRSLSLAAVVNALGVYSTPWNSSYRGVMIFRISIVSSTVGSLITKGWNLRSSAPSFSIYRRYSGVVVAPNIRNSPRANAGFRRLAAFMAPSPPPPVPIKLCISSMNKMTLLLEASLIKFCTFSSKSPRLAVPATKLANSTLMSRAPASDAGHVGNV